METSVRAAMVRGPITTITKDELHQSFPACLVLTIDVDRDDLVGQLELEGMGSYSTGMSVSCLLMECL